MTLAFLSAAQAAGALGVESFPVRPGDAVRAYRGSEQMYAELGFTIVATESDGTSDVLLMQKNFNHI